MLTTVMAIFSKEPNMLVIREPVCIVGDIHGQYEDLLMMMTKVGEPDPETQKYCFLGDYVDRGTQGVEVTMLLFAIKICLPEAFYLLRGNHESRSMTEMFTFRQEVLDSFD